MFNQMLTKNKFFAVITTAVLLVAGITFAPSANAAEKGWRYWGYYQAAPGAKTWTAAMTGPTVDVADGAVEIDVVINIGHLKSGKVEEVQNEIIEVVKAANGKQVKVILENAYLTDEEKVIACKLVEAAGADYVKTSTGFAPTGATLADVKLMRATCSPKVKVKSAGGVKTLEQLLEFLDAGIDRSGSSSTASILDEFISKYGRD
jgi:deoxyribose-phosphate aldolase